MRLAAGSTFRHPFAAAVCMQEVLAAADIELGFNYPHPIVSHEVCLLLGVCLGCSQHGCT